MDWNCTPYPQCVYDQIAASMPAGVCPTAGQTWPGCIPDWLTKLGVNLPAGAIEKPPEKDNTGLYVALSLGAAVVLGGVLYAATRPAEPAEAGAKANPVKRGTRKFDALLEPSPYKGAGNIGSVTLFENGEWSGSFRVEAPSSRASDLYEEGYRVASQNAAVKGGRVETFKMAARGKKPKRAR
jgi:hypothetical protein